MFRHLISCAVAQHNYENFERVINEQFRNLVALTLPTPHATMTTLRILQS